MRLTQLRYFIKVAECGSITRAAKELFISQPSLTKSIANLEAEYDIRLLERTSKGICVTPDGREFLAYAKEAVNACDALERTFGTGMAGPQRLCIATQQIDYMYEAVQNIYQEVGEANICVDLIETNRGAVIERVESRVADVGIVVLTEDDTRQFKSELRSKALEYHTLDRSCTYVSMCRKSPLYGAPHVTVSSAKLQLHVALDMEKEMRRELYLQQLDTSVDSSRLIFCNTVSACLYFMEQLGALLYTPKWVLGMFRGHQVHTVPLESDDGSPYPGETQLVWVKREKESLSPLEERFLAVLRAHFSGTT